MRMDSSLHAEAMDGRASQGFKEYINCDL